MEKSECIHLIFKNNYKNEKDIDIIDSRLGL
jgi:hypothetical protein